MRSAVSPSLAFVMLTLFCCPRSHSQTRPVSEGVAAKLAVRISKYDLNAENFVDALMRVGSQFQIPMGIEWVDTPAARMRLARSWKDATVRQILWEIVHTQRDYEFAVENGVIHVHSPTLIPNRQNFLRLKIGRFDVRHQVVEMASRNLYERVKLIVSPPKPGQRGGGVISSLGVNPDDPEITVELANSSVEDALDALLVASNRKIWIVTFSRDPTLTPRGFRRTLGLWTNSRVPGNEEPVWDLFHWGDALPSVAAEK